jgi:hypothetical protein
MLLSERELAIQSHPKHVENHIDDENQQWPEAQASASPATLGRAG